MQAASEQKWLEIHGLEHWTEFYTDYGVGLQRRFFDHFLKGEDNGWDTQPPVMLRVRTVDGGFRDRTEEAWPIPRTDWTTLHLDPAAGRSGRSRSQRRARRAFSALGVSRASRC